MLADALQKLGVDLLSDTLEVQMLQVFHVVPQSVKKIVRRAAHHLLRLSERHHSAIVKLIPLFGCEILRIRCIVTAAHATVVVRDREAIVNQRLLLLSCRQDERTHIQANQREVYFGVQLLIAPTAHDVVPRSRLALLEPLQADNHHSRNREYLHALGRLHVRFTFAAVPHVVLVKSLNLLEFLQTVS